MIHLKFQATMGFSLFCTVPRSSFLDNISVKSVVVLSFRILLFHLISERRVCSLGKVGMDEYLVEVFQPTEVETFSVQP
jgi:hypothetical protein